MMKKVLIITYHWPPGGGPGVQRVLKFAKYLPQFGWQPIILTVQGGEYLAIDTSLEQDINADLKVIRTKTLEPFALYKKLTSKDQDEIIPNLILTEKSTKDWQEKLSKWIRTNIFVPDARIGWIPQIVKTGKDIIDQEKPDLIFSSSPPHSIQLGAKRLAQKTGLKWIADFRDLWYDLDIFYEHNRRNFISSWLDSRMERSVFEKADGIISINKFITDLFIDKITGQKPFAIIQNGYDQQNFEQLIPEKSKKFTITYTGTMSESRIPEALILALARYNKEKKSLPVELCLIGTVCQECRNMIRQNGLSDSTKIYDYTPYAEILKKLNASSALLLVIDKVLHNEVFLTGKLFDYLGVKKPIFAIGPLNGAANQIISETNSGSMIEYEDTDGAHELLQNLIQDWQNDTSRFTFNSDKYEKRPLTKKLAEFFNQITT